MTTPHELDLRYGRVSPARRRRYLIAAIAAGAVVVGFIGWGVVAGTLDDVDADATGFEVFDEHEVSVRMQITTAPGRDVTCAVEAQDTNHGVVGWKVVDIPAGDSPTREFTVTLPTTAEATTGFVNSCWVS
ncbi:DUF4307 domain-containing protein [Microbacterium sp. C7(2022)]|uniref:DUF4307 domain-containing protein n=1 Tax=Microbacterium sp. C7(2022) TaxID=2992759 RepID=UPI00237AF118|nr:DUF4307 domain-containing protein [Microbacterium sp. C7(2022)]MDE0545775.1 DUF4307 domain-containing protein [Microbacterium sp. C7(2022)]